MARRRVPAHQLLVAGQFGLLVLLIWPPTLSGHWAMALPFVLLSVWLGGWSLLYNRPGNFNIAPAVPPHARLVTGGPYRWVRHPMYTSVLVWGAGCVLYQGGGLYLAGWGLLLTVLVLKIRIEERLLMARFPHYSKVMARYRLVPGIW